MKLDVNRLRRRPEGPRVLVALDQSTLSELVRDDARGATRERLLAGVRAGKLVRPMSLGFSDETLDSRDWWKDISDLHEELSMGIGFLDPKTIRQNETLAAAAAFCHWPPLDPVVDEAFETDPHTPRDELFAGGFRVTARFGPTDVRASEVTSEKNKEATLQVAYDDVRARRLSFDQQADGEYEAMVAWVLGPLADPGFEAEFRRKYAALPDHDGAISKYLAVSQRMAFAKTLVETFRPWRNMRWSSRRRRSCRTCPRSATRRCYGLGWGSCEPGSRSRATGTTSTISPAGCRDATS